MARLGPPFWPQSLPEKVYVGPFFWGAANGGLRDGGLRKSEDIWGKRPFSSVFWISQVLLAPSGQGRKRQKKGDFGRFRPISRKGGQTPLKPPFVTPPFAAAQFLRPFPGNEAHKHFSGAQHGVFGVGAKKFMLKKLTVVSRLIADRHFFWGDLISNYRYRIALPEELISITETDLWEFKQKISY